MNSRPTGAPRNPRSVSPWLIVLLALWFGVAGGMLRGALRWGLGILGAFGWQERPCWDTLHVLWASIAVDSLFFLIAGLLLAPLVRLLPRLPWPQMAVALFSFLAFFWLLVMPERLQLSAALMLAAGLSALLLRWMARDPEGRIRFFRRSFVPLLTLATLLCLGVVLGAKAWEKVQIAQLPQPASNARSILLIVLDTVRADHLGTYGYPRPTSPFLDRFARHSLLFENAIAASSWSLASHVSMFTGRLQCEHGAELYTYDGRFPTLAEVLAEHGFATAGFSANLAYTTCASGVGIFQHYENIFSSAGEALLKTTTGNFLWPPVRRRLGVSFRMMPAHEIRSRFLNWLDQRPDRPFFAFLNFNDAHDSYQPPDEFARRFRAHPRPITGREHGQLAASARPPDPELQEALVDSYDGEIAYLDEELRLLFAELDRRGLTDQLTIIITSDHGELLGEHGLYAHRKSLYLPEIRVPLLIRFPGETQEGRRVSTPVSTGHIAATAAKSAGLPGHFFPGISLDAYLSAEPPPPTIVFSELSGGDFPGVAAHWPIHQGWIRSALDSQWHFLLQQDGKTELYHWRDDPLEEHNLSGTPELGSEESRLRDLLRGLQPPCQEAPQTMKTEPARDAVHTPNC